MWAWTEAHFSIRTGLQSMWVFELYQRSSEKEKYLLVRAPIESATSKSEMTVQLVLRGKRINAGFC